MMETAEVPQEAPQPEPPRVCAVKFRNAGRTFDYDTAGHALKRGDLVLVEFAEVEVIATVARASALTQQQPQAGLPKILRVLGEADQPALEALRKKEAEAFKFALTKLRARGLPAKMVAAEMSFRQDRITFYVASEDRLDLRAWIRDLSTEFRARIDIRQIGARDAAKFIGGIGSCGRELCCSSWLVEFRPVSIKMAKDQNLALNPEKVSGQCGRLLCCLTYEQDTYRELRKGLPKVGKRVYTPLGDGRVKDVNVLRRKVRVQLAEGYEELDASQVSPMFGQKGELLQPNFGSPAAYADDSDEDDALEGKDGAPGGEGLPLGEGAPAAPGRGALGGGSPIDRGARNDRPRDDQGPRDRSRDERGPRGPRDDRGARRNDQRDERGPRADRPRDDRGPRSERGPGGTQGGQHSGPRRDDRGAPGRDDRGGPRRDDRNHHQRGPSNEQRLAPEHKRPSSPMAPHSPGEGQPTGERNNDPNEDLHDDLSDTLDEGGDEGDTADEARPAGQAQGQGQPGDAPRRRRRRRRRGRGGRGGGGQGGPGHPGGSGGAPGGGSP